MSRPIAFTVVVAVVGGSLPLRRCLSALRPQMDSASDEIIVPYDAWCSEVAALARDFPEVRFHRMDDPPATGVSPRSPQRHRLYERRRAAGLAHARGVIVALTEDYAVPAPDWRQRMTAAQRAEAVVGGAVENGVDRPLNWALYYCDFGRFGRPFPAGPVHYVSDVNVSYQREVLLAAAAVWQHAYQETILHDQLKARGCQLVLDDGPAVFQHRPSLAISDALRERAALGRAFGETRATRREIRRRLLYALATPILPAVLVFRCLQHMIRHQRSVRQIVTTLPYLLAFLTAYALGELSGYLAPRSE
jgi:hypothetical protein